METSNTPQKSKIAYRILALLLGSLGIHNFYAGLKKRGLIELILGLVLWGISFHLMFKEVPLDELQSIVNTIKVLRILPYIWIIFDICKVKADGNGVPFK